MNYDHPEPLKSANHHWWPRGLSSLWDSGTGVTRRLPNGIEKRTLPRNWGMIKDGHSVKLRGPWSTSFEYLFDFADANLPHLVKKLIERSANSASLVLANPYSTKDLPIDESGMQILREGVASLAVRSPRFRHISMEETASLQHQIGFPVYRDPNILVSNIKAEFEAFKSKLEVGGVYIFMYCRERSLIFGDGFYVNMFGRRRQRHRYDCLLPLTPNLCVFYFREHGSLEKRTLLAEVSKEAVGHVNHLTLMHSRDEVFYDQKLPDDLSEFEAHEFRTVPTEVSTWATQVVRRYHAWSGGQRSHIF